MIQINRKCKTCRIILREQQGGGKSKLAERIYGCKEYQKGGEPLTSIHADYADQMSYLALRNHLKKHQNLTEDLLIDSRLRQLSDEARNEKVRQIISHSDIRQAIMDAAAEMLSEGKLKGITAQTALRAAKDTADIEEKQKDRAFEMMKMYQFFASGGAKPKNLENQRNLIEESDESGL